MSKPYDMLKHLNNQRGSQPQQIQVDLKDAVQLCCANCHCPTFTQGFYLHKLSALLSPTGQDLTINQPIFICSNCHIPYDYKGEVKND